VIQAAAYELGRHQLDWTAFVTAAITGSVWAVKPIVKYNIPYFRWLLFSRAAPRVAFRHPHLLARLYINEFCVGSLLGLIGLHIANHNGWIENHSKEQVLRKRPWIYAINL